MSDSLNSVLAARVRLLVGGGSNPGMAFVAYLAMQLEPRETRDIETCATDGESFLYNPDFWQKLTPPERVGAWAHEVGHLISGHLFRCGGREHTLWSVSGDLCINAVLDEIGITLPECALREVMGVRGNDTCAEDVYNKLFQKAEKVAASAGNGKSGCQWIGPKDPARAEAQGREWQQKVIQAAQVAREAGRLPGGLETLIAAMLPQVPWKDKIRHWLGVRAKTRYSFLPPSRRYLAQGLFLPAMSGERYEVAFLVDTSGSMTDDTLCQALGEVRALRQIVPTILHILDVDAEVHQERIFPPEKPVPLKLSFQGRGGTNIQAGFEYLEKKKYMLDAVVVFTDGYTYPCPVEIKLTCPVLWILPEGCNRDVGRGDKVTVRIKAEAQAEVRAMNLRAYSCGFCSLSPC